MPRGRGRQMRWGRQGCPRRLSGFLYPCLLLLLHQGDTHGYDLIQRLEAFGFETGSLNPGLVYRALREMEQEGYVTSDWQEESLGPPRRVYRLTRQGDEVLCQWVNELGESQKAIGRFIDAYKIHMEEDKHLLQGGNL